MENVFPALPLGACCREAAGTSIHDNGIFPHSANLGVEARWEASGTISASNPRSPANPFLPGRLAWATVSSFPLERCFLMRILLTRMALMAAVALPAIAPAYADECPVAAAAKAKAASQAHIQTVAFNAQAKDIVDTAVAAGDFKTLVAAVQAAGLVETLKGPGPFTVFAPTDAAFAKLPAGTVQSLLKPENKAKLVAVLTYHVVPGKVMASDVVKLTEAPTVQGAKATVKVENGVVMIDNAKVVKTDIVTSNGVIHVIDAVILPPEKK